MKTEILVEKIENGEIYTVKGKRYVNERRESRRPEQMLAELLDEILLEGRPKKTDVTSVKIELNITYNP